MTLMQIHVSASIGLSCERESVVPYGPPSWEAIDEQDLRHKLT